MKEPQYNITFLDKQDEGAVPFFILKRYDLNSAIDTAKKMVNPVDPNAIEFHITVQCKETFEQIKLATVYWDSNVSEASAVTFPLNMEKMMNN